MNKYLVTLHTFCDACFNQRTCKGTCRRMQEMEKFVDRYEHLARAYDKVCLSISDSNKEEIKKEYLDATK